jgi:phage baseplate assembly protein V
MTPADLTRAMAPLARRMMLAIGRAVLRAVDDGAGIQRVQVSLLSEETRDDVERFQGYGLSAVPLPGAELVVVSVAGNRDNPVAIALDDRRYRPTGLEPGEVCIYAKTSGQRITLKADGSILVQSPIKVRIEAPTTEIQGNVTVTGDVTAGTVSLRNHRHQNVATGAALSGVPLP